MPALPDHGAIATSPIVAGSPCAQAICIPARSRTAQVIPPFWARSAASRRCSCSTGVAGRRPVHALMHPRVGVHLEKIGSVEGGIQRTTYESRGR